MPRSGSRKIQLLWLSSKQRKKRAIAAEKDSNDKQADDFAAIQSTTSGGMQVGEWTMFVRLFGKIVSLACFMWLARFALKRPLEGIVAAAQKLSDGELDVYIPEQGQGDEVGTIARALGSVETKRPGAGTSA